MDGNRADAPMYGSPVWRLPGCWSGAGCAGLRSPEQ
jgi:hypothetical protein